MGYRQINESVRDATTALSVRRQSNCVGGLRPNRNCDATNARGLSLIARRQAAGQKLAIHWFPVVSRMYAECWLTGIHRNLTVRRTCSPRNAAFAPIRENGTNLHSRLQLQQPVGTESVLSINRNDSIFQDRRRWFRDFSAKGTWMNN